MADLTEAEHGDVQVAAVDPGGGYVLGGKIMLSAIVILFAVVVFMVGFHLYARWYLLRLRRRQLERRRQRRVGRTHVVFYNNNRPMSSVDRGLEPAVLNSLPVSLYSAEAEQPLLECAVCLSEFEENEVVRLLPKCNHSFHIECIDMWFHSHSTCPLCRSPVEQVVVKTEPVENSADGLEQGTSSGSGICAACQLEKVNGESDTSSSSSGVRRKMELIGVRIEVPPRRVESGNELSLSSPASRLLSIKRILSMGRKSPAGSGGTTPNGAGTSRGIPESDLESGIVESVRDQSRVQTPR